MKKLEYRPAGYRILVRLEKMEEKSKGGILLTSDTLKKEQKGTESGVVVGIGEFAYSDYESPWVKVGDEVCFQRYEGFDKEIDGVHYKVLNDVDVLLVNNSQSRGEK